MQLCYSDEKFETKNIVLKMMYVQHACQSNIRDQHKYYPSTRRNVVDIEIVRVLTIQYCSNKMFDVLVPRS